MNPFKLIKKEMDFTIGSQDYNMEVKIEEHTIENEPWSKQAYVDGKAFINMTVNNFCCQNCDYSTNRSFDLKMHHHIHIGKKSYMSHQIPF